MKSLLNIFKKGNELESNNNKDKISKKINHFFIVNKNIGVSLFRLNLMRVLFIVMFLVLGLDVWEALINSKTPIDPMKGIALSFWAALATLPILWLKNPLKVIPILLLQLSYKIIWLAFIAYPLWVVDELELSTVANLAKSNFIGAILDILVIPWAYFIKKYTYFKR